MRLAYIIGAAFVAGAIFVCWRYLPAQAAETHERPATTDDRKVASGRAISDV
jgi:hypothetical protein